MDSRANPSQNDAEQFLILLIRIFLERFLLIEYCERVLEVQEVQKVLSSGVDWASGVGEGGIVDASLGGD